MIDASARLPHTAIQCLAAVANYRGVKVDPERLVVDYKSASGEPSTALLLRIAAAIGMHSRLTLLSWEDLQNQGHGFPILARTSDGNWVIVVGVRADAEGRVAVVDPLAETASVTLLDRELFCSRWQGDVVFLDGQADTATRGA